MTSYPVIRHFSACIFQFVFFENAVTAKQFDVYVHHLNFTVRVPHRKLQCNQLKVRTSSDIKSYECRRFRRF